MENKENVEKTNEVKKIEAPLKYSQTVHGNGELITLKLLEAINANLQSVVNILVEIRNKK